MGGWQWGLAAGAAVKRERERGKSEKSLVKNNYLFNLVFNKHKIAKKKL